MNPPESNQVPIGQVFPEAHLISDGTRITRPGLLGDYKVGKCKSVVSQHSGEDTAGFLVPRGIRGRYTDKH